MESAGLAIGIAGLAGLFGTCLEVVERIDSYRDFGIDLHATLSQFEADKLLFQKWGEAVGLDSGGSVTNSPHRTLDDPLIMSTVRNILISINEIAGVFGNNSSVQQQHTTSKGQVHTSGRLSLEKFRGDASRRTKVEWALRQKGRFVALSQFGGLVERLRALVPPEDAKNGVHPIIRTPTGLDLSTSGPSRPINAQAGRIPTLDPQLILVELEKQIERKWLQPPSQFD